jgi:hypothetical protein
MRWIAFLGCLVPVACSQHHVARVQAASGPPPSVEMVRHTGDLFIELRDHTPNHQCSIAAGERKLCFDRVGDALGESLEHTLWPSFRHVRVKKKADNLAPGDYLLLVDLELHPKPADDHGPGWSASATGRWQLVRDGIPLAGESFSSRSRADFYYGRSLAQGGSEVLSAVAHHVANAVGTLPELRPEPEKSLPPVTADNGFGPLAPVKDREARR